MNPQGHDQYFTTQALTAPPQKLHIMLLEAALRHGRRAEQLCQDGQNEQAGEAIVRSQEVMGELIRGLNAEVAPELVRQVATSYLFIVRSLVAAHLHRDVTKLQEALRVLEVECQTWRELCAQLESGGASRTPEKGVGAIPPPKNVTQRSEKNENSSTETGLSLEA